MNKILFILTLYFFLTPFVSAQNLLLKKEACAYQDGIHRKDLYIYWPGEYPQVDEFLKYQGKLYYFIHTFPSRESLLKYKKSGNSPYSEQGFIRNAGTFFVVFDCARSKVTFSPTLRSVSGDTYGKLYWIDQHYLSYSLIALSKKDDCRESFDRILSLPSLDHIEIEKDISYPKSSENICYSRSFYKSLGNGKVQFDIEKHDKTTGESWFSRYQYQIQTRKLRKIR